MFATFDLEDLRDRMAGTLSAGQKRRLGLARLGVIGRKVLFLGRTDGQPGYLFSVRMFARWLREDHLGAGGIAVIATHIDLGMEAPELDLTPFRADPMARGGQRRGVPVSALWLLARPGRLRPGPRPTRPPGRARSRPPSGPPPPPGGGGGGAAL